MTAPTPDLSAWSVPVDGAELLGDLEFAMARFVAFPSPAALVAVVLWVGHAHAVDAFESTPRLAVLSTEKQSGKTRLLELLELLLPNARHAVNMTAAALFRIVEAESPVLLFDECDTYFGPKATEHEELRGLVNAGHRRGAVAYRVVGEGGRMEVKAFPAYAAVALAGIGGLPDTILDRSVVIGMKRRAPDEHVEPFPARKAGPVLRELGERLADWTGSRHDALAAAEPDMPAGITDRPADVWEPLLAVADVAGGDWPERARTACLSLNAARAEADPSEGVRLLADVREAFIVRRTDKLPTDDLLEYLTGLVEASWGDLRGRPLDPRALAHRLRPYGVRPRKVRLGDNVRQGYDRADLHDAFTRYLPPPKSGTTGTAGTSQVSEPENVPDSEGVPEHSADPERFAPALTCAVPGVPHVPDFPERDRAEAGGGPAFPRRDEFGPALALPVAAGLVAPEDAP